jgi:hypothetical protein
LAEYKTKKNKAKHNTICLEHHHTYTKTNTVTKTCRSLLVLWFLFFWPLYCPSIYGFRLLHWYLQTFLIKLTNMIRTIIKQILTNQKQKSLYEKGVFEEYHIPRALKNKYVSMSYVITVYIVMKKAILPFTSRYTIFYQHQLIMIIYCPEFIY